MVACQVVLERAWIEKVDFIMIQESYHLLKSDEHYLINRSGKVAIGVNMILDSSFTIRKELCTENSIVVQWSSGLEATLIVCIDNPKPNKRINGGEKSWLGKLEPLRVV